MFSSRPQFGRFLWGMMLVCVLGATAVCQTSDGIVLRETAQGVAIGVPGKTIGEPRVLRLPNPDRLVLDFSDTELGPISSAERAQWRSRGVRMAYHEEDQTTRIVFEIPSGAQRWITRENGDVIVTDGRTAMAQPSAAPVVNPSPRPRIASVRKPVSTQPKPATQPGAQPVVDPLASPQVPPHLDVAYNDGLLTVSARDVSFESVLQKIASATGADLQLLVPVTDVQGVAYEYGPASAVDVVRQLFTGAQYNYILITEPNSETRISRIVVTGSLKDMPLDEPPTDEETTSQTLHQLEPMEPTAKQNPQPIQRPD